MPVFKSTMELNEKQIQILEVAEKLFSETGFDGTSVRNIAKEAEINVAMISYYFGSKEKLLEALVNYRMADFKIELDSIITQPFSYLEKIDAIVELLIKRIHRNRRTHKIVNFEYSSGNRSIDFNNYIQRKRENYEVLENFIKQGQKEGFFSKKVNCSLIAPTVLGTYFHFYYNKKFFRDIHYMGKEISIDEFVFTTLTEHIQQTIKGLLTYED